MIRSVGLARTQDLTNVYRLTFGLDDARVASGLKNVGVAVSLYGGQPTGRLQDLVRQLARMRVDNFLFWVSPEVAVVNRRLTLGLKQLRPSVRILWWGPFLNDFSASRIAQGATEALGAVQPEEVIPKLIEAKLLPEDSPTDLPSPYLRGLLCAEDAPRLGLTAHQEPSVVAEELTWLTTHAAIEGLVVRLDGTRLDPDDLVDLCQAIVKCAGIPKLELHLSVQARPSAIASFISMCGVTKVVLHGEKVEEEHTALTLAGVKSDIAAPADHEIATKTDRARKGFITTQTGFYPNSSNQGAGIYHLELPLAMQSNRRFETYEWAARNLNLSCAAVLTTGELPPIGDLERFQTHISQETEGWPRHTYIVSTNADGRLVVDGCSEASFAVRFVSYADLNNSPMQDKMLTIVRIRTDADIAVLVQRLEQFHTTGIAEVFHPGHLTVFENSCRWSRYGSCSVSLLRRLQVEHDGKVLSCRDSGHIGTVGDDYERMLTCVGQNQQLMEVRRGCALCPVRDECSHCVHLPNQWGGQYCEIRKKNPSTALFFEVNAFPIVVERMLPPIQGKLIVRVSSTSLPMQHYDGPVGPQRKGVRPIIVSICDRNFAWWRGTLKITRLSGPLALVLEGWWLGATEPDLRQALCRRFGVEPQVAESGLKEAIQKLRQGGLLSA